MNTYLMNLSLLSNPALRCTIIFPQTELSIQRQVRTISKIETNMIKARNISYWFVTDSFCEHVLKQPKSVTIFSGRKKKLNWARVCLFKIKLSDVSLWSIDDVTLVYWFKCLCLLFIHYTSNAYTKHRSLYSVRFGSSRSRMIPGSGEL